MNLGQKSGHQWLRHLWKRLNPVFTDSTERTWVEQALRDKTEQLQAITEAMSAFLESGDWREVSTLILRRAVSQTESECGFIGAVVEGPILRILAHDGVVWDMTTNREFYENALRTYREVGYLEFTNFDNLFGTVITSGKAVLSNDPSTDPRSGGLPLGHPPLRHFLGVPILRKTEVVGLIGVANRPGGYTGTEQTKIEILTRAASVLYNDYRRQEREAALEEKRRQAEEQIRASLQEKEVLLKEIHHRVKNNLQIISSLLSLQSRHIKYEQALEMFKDSQNRVKSMALIHERLYHSEDLSRIDFAKYTQSLTTHLFQSYGVHSNVVKLKLNVVDVFLGIDTAIPCGLIINELVSNSLKHAFPAGREGSISIALHSDEDNQLTLMVSDTGVGFPKDVDFRNTSSLGLKLVRTLTDQLGGTIELERSGGAAFKITFAELSYEKRS
jgi:two-component sensor histidine kinase